MLYANGQLLSLYSEAYQVTREPLYREVVKFGRGHAEPGAGLGSRRAPAPYQLGQPLRGAAAAGRRGSHCGVRDGRISARIKPALFTQ